MFLDFYGDYYQWSVWFHPICFYVYIIRLFLIQLQLKKKQTKLSSRFIIKKFLWGV